MVIFLSSALLTYLLWPNLRAWWAHGNRIARTARVAAIVLLIAAWIGILCALIVLPDAAWPIWARHLSEAGWLTSVRDIAFDPETVHAMLGVVAGILSRELWAWTRKAPYAHDGWRLAIFIGALGAVTLAALLAPYAPTVMNRISEVGSPWVDIKFTALIPDKQIVLDIDRDVMTAADSFEDLPRAPRFIQYDCGDRAIFFHGIGNFRNNHTAEYEEFQNAIWFRTKSPFYDFVSAVLAAEFEAKNQPTQPISPEYRGLARLEILKGRVGRIAHRLDRLVSDRPSRDFASDYNAAENDAKAQRKMLLEKEGAQPYLPHPHKERPEERVAWCDPPRDKPDVSADKIRSIFLNTRETLKNLRFGCDLG